MRVCGGMIKVFTNWLDILFKKSAGTDRHFTHIISQAKNKHVK